MKPEYVSQLEDIFGPPSSSGWGSAVFFEPDAGECDLGDMALTTYRSFVGRLWDRYGAEAWMSDWAAVVTRRGPGNLVEELETNRNAAIGNALPLLLGEGDNKDRRTAAISGAFDRPETAEVQVYTIGDGGQVSGILIIGRQINGETASLVFLFD